MPLFQKGLWLREYLLSLRYPRYTALTSKLKHAIHNLKLPKYISLSTDELLTLEKKHLNFSVLCKKTDDLSSSGQYLAELAKSEEIKRIVTILNEE
jgi:hypothetical protein